MILSTEWVIWKILSILHLQHSVNMSPSFSLLFNFSLSYFFFRIWNSFYFLRWIFQIFETCKSNLQSLTNHKTANQVEGKEILKFSNFSSSFQVLIQFQRFCFTDTLFLSSFLFFLLSFSQFPSANFSWSSLDVTFV